MRYLLLLALLLLALPLAAQEATETPEAPEATAEPTATALPYAWCGYLLLEHVIVDTEALAVLAELFPPADGDAPPNALMQWRPRPDGLAGILEGCHLLPVERWRVVSLLQQGTGMTYEQMDATLVMTQFDAAGMLAWLDVHAEWEDTADAPFAEATPEL